MRCNYELLISELNNYVCVSVCGVKQRVNMSGLCITKVTCWSQDEKLYLVQFLKKPLLNKYSPSYQRGLGTPRALEREELWQQGVKNNSGSYDSCPFKYFLGDADPLFSNDKSNDYFKRLLHPCKLILYFVNPRLMFEEIWDNFTNNPDVSFYRLLKIWF